MRSCTKQHVRRFLIRATTFVVVFFLIDFALGQIVRLGYFSQENKNTYSMLKSEAEVIIVGSSRANSHYIPSIFSDTLRMSCFNTGSGGQNIYYYFGIIGSILERYEPRIIIVDVMDSDIVVRKEEIDKLSELLPFYHSSESIKEMIDLRGPMERIKLLSAIYPFNSQVTSIIYSYIKKGRNPHLLMDGYIPLDGIINSVVLPVEREDSAPLDSVKTEIIERIALQCHKHDVRLILIVSPIFTKFEGNNNSIKSLKDIISKFDIELWDYEQAPYFLSHGDLFRDELHLNHTGAIEYSKMIAGRIKQSNLIKK